MFFFLKANPLPLTHLCRRVIRQKIGKSNINEVNKLELPITVKNFLLYK
jgi:SPRY domain-containing SOCS box protein 1/4